MIDVQKPVSFKTIFIIALPMVVSQGTETVMMFTDRFFLSLLGKQFITASMSGGLSSFVFSSFFLGVIGYVNALVAQYYGAKQFKNCFKATAQALWLSLFCYPLSLVLIPAVHWFFVWAGHSPGQVALEFSYFRILMAGSFFVFIRTALSGYFIGIGKTPVVMASNILGMIINIPLNYIFIFGIPGLPAMGIEGAAFGTLGGSLVSCLFLVIALPLDKLYRNHTNRRNRWWGINGSILKKLLSFGIPAGGELFVNVFLFNFFVQLMFSYGEDVAAAVVITFNYDMLAFIPLLGLSYAVTALTGQQMGAGNIQGAKKVILSVLKLTYVYASIMVLLFVLGADLLVSVFSMGFSADDQAVLPLARIMLRLAAIYLLADGTQIVFGGGLRGAGDTRWVMYISVGLHVMMALGTYVMIKILHIQPIGVWLYFIGFVLSLGVSMFLRYKTNRWQKIKMVNHEESGESEIIEETYL
ncbi:MAG: MATE family efflux transporter [Spirochaetales bacterium]|nr:MATE family efflux transporter [Spirochaetales bacterium]